MIAQVQEVDSATQILANIAVNLRSSVRRIDL
jgi:hypothetical protein